MCSITGDQTSARPHHRAPSPKIASPDQYCIGQRHRCGRNDESGNRGGLRVAVFAAGLVFCATTTTTNTIFPAGMPNDRSYIFNVPTSASVISGATVDGFGLRFETTAPGGAVTVTNDGTITLSDPGADGQPAVLQLVWQRRNRHLQRQWGDNE